MTFYPPPPQPKGKENGMPCRHDTDCKYGHCSVCPLNGLLTHKACGQAIGRRCNKNDDCCNHRTGGFCVETGAGGVCR